MCPRVRHRFKSYTQYAPKANEINLYTNTTAVSTGLPITIQGSTLHPVCTLDCREQSQEEPKKREQTQRQVQMALRMHKAHLGTYKQDVYNTIFTALRILCNKQ